MHAQLAHVVTAAQRGLQPAQTRGRRLILTAQQCAVYSYAEEHVRRATGAYFDSAGETRVSRDRAVLTAAREVALAGLEVQMVGESLTREYSRKLEQLAKQRARARKWAMRWADAHVARWAGEGDGAAACAAAGAADARGGEAG
eukprot:3730304-Prymnesium_polylepis.2